MKTERRHELTTNELADSLGGFLDTTLKPYAPYIGATILAAAVLGGGYYLVTTWQADARQQEWNDLYFALDAQAPPGATAAVGDPRIAALEKVVKDHPQADAGQMARLALADAKLAEGVEALFSDRAKALGLLREALDMYGAVRNEARHPLLLERATLGVARAHESLGDLDAAKREYAEAVKKWPTGPFSGMASRRLADLERSSTVAFYQWFAAQQPRPAPTGLPGMPGDRLPFDPGAFPPETPPSGDPFLTPPPSPTGPNLGGPMGTGPMATSAAPSPTGAASTAPAGTAAPAGTGPAVGTAPVPAATGTAPAATP